MMKSSVASSNEYVWIAEDLPNAKPLSKNGLEKHRQKQMPKNNSHSTNTYTRTDMETTTISTDDSPKRKNLPSVAKSDMYKTKLCRNYMDTGKCKYGRVCQFAHGRKELEKYSLFVEVTCELRVDITCDCLLKTTNP